MIPMETRWKILLVTLAIAIPAFMLGGGTPAGHQMWSAIWPFESPVEEPAATAGQVPFFMLLGVIEAISLGLAVSFLIFGRRFVLQAASGARGRANVLYIAIAWILGNWWIHDNVHMINGMNLTGLLVIEYLFHVTLIAAGAFLAYNFHRLTVGGAKRGQKTASSTPA